MKEFGKKNWFFIILFLALAVVFMKRDQYLTMPVVSIPDAQVRFSTEDVFLEQTWQPTVKRIAGVSIPYFAENDFSCNAEIRIYSDDGTKLIVENVKEQMSFTAGEEGELAFAFDPKDVVPGERYRIRFSLTDANVYGSLQIASGSNYGGCNIAGEEQGQAAAITVTFLKFSRLFWLAAVLFPLFSFSLLTMVLTGRKWEETVALSLFMEGILLYIFGLSEHLTWGIYVCYGLAVLAFLYAVAVFQKKKLRLTDLSSAGLWIYLVFFGLILITCNGDWIAIRDELRHWEIAVRDMFYYDAFAKHANTTVILPRYIPFAAVIEYVFEFMNGMFSEDILLIAYQTMLLSVSVIVCRPLNREGGWKRFVPAMIAMVGIPVLFFYNISSCIMVDSLLAVLFAYCLICYFTEDLSFFNILRIAGGMVTLVLVKDIGLIYAGMMTVIMLGDILITGIRTKHLRIKHFLFPIGAGMLALLLFFSWQVYLSIPAREPAVNIVQESVSVTAGETIQDDSYEKEDEGQNEAIDTAISASGISLEGIKKILTGEGEPYQYEVTYNFVKELFEGETYMLGNLPVSFMDLLAVIVLVVFVFGYFDFWHDKGRMYGMAVMLFLTSFLLCTFLQITYWFTFGRYEAMELTSVDRYLAPYLCAGMMLVFYMLYNRMWELGTGFKKQKCLVGVLAFLLIISMPVSGLIRESKDQEGNATENVVYGHSEIAEILRSVAGRGERAYFICSGSGGLSEYVFRNTVCPVISKHELWNIVSTEEAVEEACHKYGGDGLGVEVLSVENWKKALKECDYVVVFHADDLFRHSYEEVFEAGDSIEDGSVYQVLHEGEEISLEFIGMTGIKEWY